MATRSVGAMAVVMRCGTEMGLLNRAMAGPDSIRSRELGWVFY